MDRKPHGFGAKGLLAGLALCCLAILGAAYVSGALPGGLGRWLGLPAGVEEAETREFLLPVRDGRVPEDLRLIRVAQGDLVTITWTADRPTILHLHGYDIELEVRPGSSEPLAFRAYAAGRFPIEAHPQGGEPAADRPALVYLEVYPR